MSVNEKKHRNKILNTIKRMGYSPSYYERKNETGECGHVYFNSPKWVSYFKRYCGSKLNKRIPKDVYDWDVESKLAFLSGYIDGDGCCREEGISTTSISKKISYGVWQLLRDCNIMANINYHGRTGESCKFTHSNGTEYESHPQWRVVLNRKESLYLYKSLDSIKKSKDWNSDASNAMTKKTKDYYAHSLRYVNKNKILPVYNLEVEGDNSYIADGLVVHNCDPTWIERDPYLYYSACDAITTSSQALADYIIKEYELDIPVVHVPDRIDIDGHIEIKVKHNKKIQRLVWFGYSKNFVYVRPEFLEYILKNDISITAYSDYLFTMDKEYKDIKFNWIQHEQSRLQKELKNYDAAILPAQRELVDPLGKFKARGRPSECYSLGLPVIEYMKDFDRLETQESREKESKDKLEYAKEKLDVRLSARQYMDIIDSVRKSPNKQRSPKKLLVWD